MGDAYRGSALVGVCGDPAPILRGWRFPPAARRALFLAAAVALAGPVSADPALAREAEALRELLGKGEYARAHKAAQDLVVRAERAGDRPSLGRALLRLGDAAYYEGHPSEAWALYEKALSVFRALDDPGGRAEADYSLSFRYERSRPQEMIAALERAGPLATRAGDLSLQMRIQNALGTACWGLSRHAQALEHFEAAGHLARETKDDRSLAIAYSNRGLIQEERARHEEALRLLEQALALFEALGRSPTIGNTLNSIADVHRSQGDLEGATSFYERAHRAHLDFGNKRGESASLEGLAAISEDLAEGDRAQALRREALRLSLEIQDERRTIRLLCGLASGLVAAGRTEEAVADLEDAERRARGNDPGLLIVVYRARAALDRARQNPGGAVVWLARAEDAAAGVGDRLRRGECAGLLGEILEDLGRGREALASYRRAIALHEATKTRSRLHVWHGRAARLFARDGDALRAREHYAASLRLVEDLDRLLATDRFRLHLFEEVADVYAGYAAFLASQLEVESAWSVLELGRARVLRLRLLEAGDGSRLSPGEQDALARLSALQRRLGEASPDEQGRLGALVDEAEGEYERAVREAGRATPASPPPALTVFPEAAVVVEYAVAGGDLLVFSERSGQMRVRRLGDAGSLVERIERFSAAVSNADEPFRGQGEARALFETLLGDELSALPGGRVVVVPDGRFRSLPFGALQCAEGVFLAERFTLSEAPSLGVLAGLRSQAGREGAGHAILALANTRFDGQGNSGARFPRLSATAAEARRAARSAPGSTLLIDPLESEVKGLPFSRYELVHFATHTANDEMHPERSSIVLGGDAHEDGYLQAREIYRMAIPCRLVVVSGCRSGRGRLVAGEGLVGLSHAFLAAGARSLVLSHWDVTDDGAARFMGRFYDALPDRSIAEAIQEAQRATLRSGDGHPARWAAFFVSGDADQHLGVRHPGPGPASVLGATTLLAALAALGLKLYRLRGRASRR